MRTRAACQPPVTYPGTMIVNNNWPPLNNWAFKKALTLTDRSRLLEVMTERFGHIDIQSRDKILNEPFGQF
jgi:hypothetical protein